ncbi:DUF2975 domain-containing protein [Vibrio sp. Isolate34]|uniref:DUF2975 domain-containing protein n=1 Tax=Vibrio sp. Isolate34 TaxID=2908540 RepID=UPI001EFCFCDE|nr:DUF2975 domain-containing protein [Vibrio sp. Isolate34]MCG9638397.1 DUF2975 domain-containing protein [Vibrio sp. Isolate34]
MKKISIEKLSKTIQVVALVIAALSGLISIVLWFLATVLSPEWIDASFPVVIETPIGLERSLLGSIPAMFPVIQFMLIFITLSKLFKCYSRSIIFEAYNAQLIKRVGLLLLISPFVTLVSDIGLSFVLTYSQGLWEYSVSFTDSDITNFFIGVIVICISRVMRMAAIINEENKLTI